MHSHTLVEPCSDSSREHIRSLKHGRLAGLRGDTGFAFQGKVTVIGAHFKASASPGRMLSKLTVFAGFLSRADVPLSATQLPTPASDVH